MMPRFSFAATTFLGTTLFASGVYLAQKRVPSTPEERARVVRLAHRLETEPLGEEAKKSRQTLHKWMKDVPDLSILVCPSLLKGKEKSRYSEELTLQLSIAVAAFMIEHPQRAENQEEKILAGIYGMLKTYQSIKASDPKTEWHFLDSLIELQKAGRTNESLRAVMARCSKIPLSDIKNKYQAGDTVFAPIEVDREVKIQSKPEPQYTNEARDARIKGVVVLQAVLASSGKVTDIIVLKGLEGGLTQAAISAARGIRFEPATKYNRRVSTMVILEYHFGFYYRSHA